MFNETSQATPREVLCDSISMQCIRDVVPAIPRDDVLCDFMQGIQDVVPAIPRDDVLCAIRDVVPAIPYPHFHAMMFSAIPCNVILDVTRNFTRCSNARGLLVGRGTARNLVGVCRIFRTLRNSPMFPRFSMRQFSARRRLLCIFPCRARNSNGPIRLHLTMVSLGNSIAVSWETKQCSPSFLCCCVVAVFSRNVFNKK